MPQIDKSSGWAMTAGALALAAAFAAWRSQEMHAVDAMLSTSLCGALDPTTAPAAFGHCAACWTAVAGGALSALAGLRALLLSPAARAGFSPRGVLRLRS